MDNKLSVSYCTLLACSSWAVGIAAFLLISFGVLDIRHSGLALVFMTGGTVLHLRRLINGMRSREEIAYRLGVANREVRALRKDL
jgi:hypothetical protein